MIFSMISLGTAWAITLRHLRLWSKDVNYLLAGLYWPLLDVITMGFLGLWIQQLQGDTSYNYEVIALMGILLWQVVGRGCNFTCFAFYEELWANNVVNLFSLPLRLADWIVGVLFFTLIMMAMTALTGMSLIFLLYNVSWWQLCTTFLLFMPPLVLSSIWLSFTALQLVVLLGKRSIELGFVIAWFLLPFSGAYYPIEVLPAWAKMISACLPMSYVFEGMRNYLMYQQDPTTSLMKGYALGALYALCAIAGFIYCFNRSKHKGLARLNQ